MARAFSKEEVDYITRLLALGNTHKQIREKVQARYRHGVADSTIRRIRKENSKQIQTAHDALAGSDELIAATALQQKSYKLLDRRLDRALKDDSEIDSLRLKLQTGEIDKAEFDAQVKRYERLTINELTKIADTTHTHAKGGDEAPAMTQADQAALQVLVEGIRSGNPFQLVQVLNPPRGTQVPPTQVVDHS